MLALLKKLNLLLMLLMLTGIPALTYGQDDLSLEGDDDLGDLLGGDELTEGLDTEVVDVSDELLDLEGMDLEALLNVEVSSVAGVGVSLHETPAALFVITSDDLRRTGVQSIPEALRMVPGMQVARQDANTYAISARGYNGRFANKLLVIQDGRSIYTPIFAGTYWDSHEVLLADIATIEVIRGPGATLWGANAVNGVINITSKKAEETQGVYLQGTYGDQLAGFSARYGGKIGEDTHFRVWTRYRELDGMEVTSPAIPPDQDGGSQWFAGARIDHQIDEMTIATLHLKGARGTNKTESTTTIPGIGSVVRTPDDHFNNAAYVYEVKHENTDKEYGWAFKTYLDYYRRQGEDTNLILPVPFPPFAVPASFTVAGIETTTFDFDFRHHFKLGDRNKLIWGINYRHTYDDLSNSVITVPPGPPVIGVGFNPLTRDYAIYSGFIQDTITILEDELHLMVGSKFSHNDYSGYEIQPSARLWWTPTEETTLWTSVARAVRSPSRVENDILFGGVPLGFRNLEAEDLLAIEAGYRQKIGKKFSADFAAYLNIYDDLIGFPTTTANSTNSYSYGAELTLNYQPVENVRISTSYSVAQINEEGFPSGVGLSVDPENELPEHIWNARVFWDITERLEANAAFYFSTGFTSPGVVGTQTKLDLGVTYDIAENIQISAWGMNLLDDSTLEFFDSTNGNSAKEVERSFLVQLTFTDK